MTQALSLTMTPAGLLNMNQRGHWVPRYRRTKEIRGLVAVLARAYLEPVACRQAVTATYQWPDNRRRDAENWAPTTKACIDGLRDAGILPDDDKRWVASVTNQQGDRHDDRRQAPMVKITIELQDAS